VDGSSAGIAMCQSSAVDHILQSLLLPDFNFPSVYDHTLSTAQQGKFHA
jgi:hypothetical protein